jgi:predicted MFS family arabinose efflux permease
MPLTRCRPDGGEPRPLAVGRWHLVVVCLGASLAPLDAAVNAAFPAIVTAFGRSPRDIQWVILAFVVVQSLASLLFGRLGDRWGHRRMFAIGVAASVFTHAGIVLAPDFATLVAWRALQGAGIGLALACAPALVTLPYPPEHKRRMLGRYIAALGAAMAIAPLLGGWLVDHFGWQGVYGFRVPVALLALAGLGAVVDAHADRPQPLPRPARAQAARPAWRRRGFVALQVLSIAINAGCFAHLLLMPFAISDGLGASAALAGALLALHPGAALAGTLLAGRAAARLPAIRAMQLGVAFAVTGLLGTAAFIAEPTAAALGIAMAVTGFGLGLFQVGYADLGTSMLPAAERGLAGSLINVTRLLGIVVAAPGIGALHAILGTYARTYAIVGLALLAAASLAIMRVPARADTLSGPTSARQP